MSLLDAFWLGLIQGLTEFLPVSSSGHLALAKAIMGLDADGEEFTALVVFVHLGTALSVLTIYRQEVGAMVYHFFASLRKPPGRWLPEYRRNKHFRKGILILGTLVPTGIAFIFVKDLVEAAFDEPKWVGCMLIVTAILLTLTMLRKHPSGHMSMGRALMVGVAQSFAMLPGISRSGSTIAASLYLNVEREEAANFSFLMAIPVILAGALIEAKDLLEKGIGSDKWLAILLATVVAYFSGLVAIHLVLHFVRRGKLQYFAVYCVIAGGLALWLL